MGKTKQIRFSCSRHDDWWELFFYPISFSECLPLLYDSIEGDQVVLLEFEGVNELEKVGISGLDSHHDLALYTFPKPELAKFKDVEQWDLDWADFKKEPSAALLKQVDIRVFDNTIAECTDLFCELGTSIAFSSHDNETAYMYVRDHGIALRFLQYLLSSFHYEIPEGRSATELPDTLFPRLLDRSPDTLIIDQRDVLIAEGQITFPCWHASSAERVKAFDVNVRDQEITFSDWEERPRPEYVHKHIYGAGCPVRGCLWFLGVLILAIIIFAICRTVF